MIPLAHRIATAKKAAAVRKKVKAARQAPERSLHIAVAQYLTLALQPPHWFSTFPSGGGGKARGGQLKACGLKAGIPDLLLINGRSGRACWIELKAEHGRVSNEQIAMFRTLESAQCGWAVCKTIDEVQWALERWGFNIKARAA